MQILEGADMSIISEELKKYINQSGTLKSIATVSREGIPHVAYKGTLHTEENQIVFYDLIQSSQTNKNLVNAIWYEQKVAVNILTEDKRSFLIVGNPIKSVTAGKAFEKIYVELQEKLGQETDLNAIWYIQPISIREETYLQRKQEEETKYPYIKHLDRIVDEEKLI